MRFIFIMLAAAFVCTSCQTGEADNASVSSDPGNVRKLYVLKCAKCHELYDPKAYNDADWEMWMSKMRKKSKLKPEQFDAIRSYTEKIRNPEPNPAPVPPI